MKGNIADFIMIPVIIFVIAVAAGPMLAVTQNYVPLLKNFLGNNGAPDESIAALDVLSNLNVTFDQIFLMVAIGLGLGTIVSSFFIKSHPAFFFISLLIFLIAMAIVPVLSNAFNQYISHYPNFDYLQQLPITSFILQNYALYLLAIFVITGILLYGKLSRGAE